MNGTIKCACLVDRRNDELLMVRVRDNLKWYLPGGKLEENETPKQALIREIYEELTIELFPESIHYLTSIVGPAYGQDAKVELICFSAKWQGDIIPSAEITEVSYLSLQNRALFAPAVCKLYEEFLGVAFND